MDISNLTIKELERLFKQEQENQITDELLAACRNDSRIAAQKLVQKYERQGKKSVCWPCISSRGKAGRRDLR